MSKKTRDIILESALKCFCQHGYATSNIKLISKYSCFSRVTIHKHFANKKGIFRALIRQHAQRCQVRCLEIRAEKLEPWLSIAKILTMWGKPEFLSVSDLIVLDDLKYHSRLLAADLYEEHALLIIQILEQIIQEGIDKNIISIQGENINTTELATMIVAFFSGVIGSYPPGTMENQVSKMMSVFRCAYSKN